MSDDLISFFESQIELEKKIVQSVADALEDIDNLAVKTALTGISLDSSKHAEMYRSAIALLTSSSTALNEEQLDLQRRVVERHIKMEEVVIKQLEAKMPGVENEKLELLLKAILLDERRHHKLLKTLLEILVRGETVTEGDWWDAIWGDVPGLWT
jgi:ribonucleotide reductase beta subunit family protein with ferritin-like domain